MTIAYRLALGMTDADLIWSIRDAHFASVESRGTPLARVYRAEAMVYRLELARRRASR